MAFVPKLGAGVSLPMPDPAAPLHVLSQRMEVYVVATSGAVATQPMASAPATAMPLGQHVKVLVLDGLKVPSAMATEHALQPEHVTAFSPRRRDTSLERSAKIVKTASMAPSVVMFAIGTASLEDRLVVAATVPVATVLPTAVDSAQERQSPQMGPLV